MQTDSLFYRLFQRLPSLLFDLLGQPTAPAALYRFESVELKQTAFRLDGVFRPPPDQPDWPIYFIEVQFQRRAAFYPRLFAEIFLYLHQHQPVHPWRAVVLYPSRAVDPGEHPHYAALLTSQVQRIYLDEWCAPQQSLSQRLMGVLLAEPQPAVVAAQSLLGQLRAESVTLPTAPQLVELLETILVYKLPHLSRQEIQTMLGFIDQDLKQTRFYQDVFAEGKEEGLQEGLQEGERKEGIKLILRQLQRRCGELEPGLRERVSRLSLAQLEELGEALLEFSGPADLERWLQQHPESG